MFFLDPIETTRDIDVIDYNNEPCLHSNGTIITIPAFCWLVHEEYEKLHDKSMFDLSGLFFALQDELSITEGKKRYVTLKPELRNLWVLSYATDEVDFFGFELKVPPEVSLSFQIRSRGVKTFDFMGD